MKNSLYTFYKIFTLALAVALFQSCSTDEPSGVNLMLTPSFIYSEEDFLDFDSIDSPVKHTTLLPKLEIYDSINSCTRTYNLLLPESYSEGKKFPVLYLLHGKSTSSLSWIDPLKLDKILDRYYEKGLQELIVVMPDGGSSFYVDGYEEGELYDSFFTKIFRPFIEGKYLISDDRSNRFVAGFSMGGYGTLYHALKYRDEFSFCYAMSAPVAGKNHPAAPSVFTCLRSDTDLPYMILDVGVSDRFAAENLEAHLLLSMQGIRHEFILREGAHDFDFWTRGLVILFNRLMKMQDPKYND